METSLRGISVEPDTLVSIHGLALGSIIHFRNSENISDGLYYCVLGTRGSANTSPTLYFHASGYWVIYHTSPLGVTPLA